MSYAKTAAILSRGRWVNFELYLRSLSVGEFGHASGNANLMFEI